MDRFIHRRIELAIKGLILQCSLHVDKIALHVSLRASEAFDKMLLIHQRRLLSFSGPSIRPVEDHRKRREKKGRRHDLELERKSVIGTEIRYQSE
tara:strand:+ start:511 stop:795 length:285 start_codon:yes stop_codon:yes gene_type:complete